MKSVFLQDANPVLSRTDDLVRIHKAGKITELFV